MGLFSKLKNLVKKILKIDTGMLGKFRAAGGIVGENVVCWGYLDIGHAFLIEIGNNVTISNAAILAHDGSTKNGTGYSRVGKVKIGNNCFIGYGAIILPGVTIGNDVIIGAGSIINKDVPDDSVVVGNPGRIICKYSDYIAKHKELQKNKPKFETYWTQKSEDEKLRMREEIIDIGYDI